MLHRPRIRRRARAALRRLVAPLVREQLEAAQEAEALRAEVAALEDRIDGLTARMRELIDRLEEG